MSEIKRVKKRPESLPDMAVGDVFINPGSGELVQKVEAMVDKSFCNRCCFRPSRNRYCDLLSNNTCARPNSYFVIVDREAVETKPPGHDTAIGGVFRDQTDGPLLKVEEHPNCSSCYYTGRARCCSGRTGCCGPLRKDGKSVTFREVEEAIEEPAAPACDTELEKLRARNCELETCHTNSVETILQLRQEATRTVAEIVAEIKRLRPGEDCHSLTYKGARVMCNDILTFIEKLDPPEPELMSFAEACGAVSKTCEAAGDGCRCQVVGDPQTLIRLSGIAPGRVSVRMNPGDEKKQWQLVPKKGASDGLQDGE